MTETRALDLATVERLYAQARAGRWSLTMDAFAGALESSVRKALPSIPDRRQIERYLASLHLEDLAIACACAQGSDSAWEHFIQEYRPTLYRAADAIDPSGSARDLADSLYGELFGLEERDGVRRSHFRYFHGRSSLGTWLRAVLSQRFVDRVRSGRRLEPLPEDESPAALAAPHDEVDPGRAGQVALAQRAVSAAVSGLAPRDRLRLRCYYAQRLTLSQIGQMLGESEATASRHLSRIRRVIRNAAEQALRQEQLGEAAMAECFSALAQDPGSMNLAELLGPGPGPGTESDPRKKRRSERSKNKEQSRAVR